MTVRQELVKRAAGLLARRQYMLWRQDKGDPHPSTRLSDRDREWFKVDQEFVVVKPANAHRAMESVVRDWKEGADYYVGTSEEAYLRLEAEVEALAEWGLGIYKAVYHEEVRA